MSTKKHVLPATIAQRFGITEDELLRSRRRRLFPGNTERGSPSVYALLTIRGRRVPA